MRAYVEQNISDKAFYISPVAAGAYGVAFKEKWQADRVASAINAAYEDGRNDVKRALRELIGAAEETEL